MRHRPILLHRLFYAVRPTGTLATKLAQSAIWLGPTGRPVRDEHLHITLGIVDDHPEFPNELAARMVTAGEAVSAAPFRIVLDQLVGSPTAIALRPSRKIPALDAVRKQLETAMRTNAILERPGWRCRPHLTLLYRAGTPFSQAIDGVSWTAEEFVLVHSLVGRTEHEVLARWSLRG